MEKILNALSGNGFQPIDYIVFAAYIVLLVGLGIFLSRGKKGEEKSSTDYFLGHAFLYRLDVVQPVKELLVIGIISEQGHVSVGMRVDESGHDKLSEGVDAFVRRIHHHGVGSL